MKLFLSNFQTEPPLLLYVYMGEFFVFSFLNSKPTSCMHVRADPIRVGLAWLIWGCTMPSSLSYNCRLFPQRAFHPLRAQNPTGWQGQSEGHRRIFHPPLTKLSWLGSSCLQNFSHQVLIGGIFRQSRIFAALKTPMHDHIEPQQGLGGVWLKWCLPHLQA